MAEGGCERARVTAGLLRGAQERTPLPPPGIPPSCLLRPLPPDWSPAVPSIQVRAGPPTVSSCDCSSWRALPSVPLGPQFPGMPRASLARQAASARTMDTRRWRACALICHWAPRLAFHMAPGLWWPGCHIQIETGDVLIPKGPVTLEQLGTGLPGFLLLLAATLSTPRRQQHLVTNVPSSAWGHMPIRTWWTPGGGGGGRAVSRLEDGVSSDGFSSANVRASGSLSPNSLSLRR